MGWVVAGSDGRGIFVAEGQVIEEISDFEEGVDVIFEGTGSDAGFGSVRLSAAQLFLSHLDMNNVNIQSIPAITSNGNPPLKQKPLESLK